MKKTKAFGAGLIHPVIPDVAGTLPRPNINGDKVYADARALCYGAAVDALKPYRYLTYREREIIDAISEWLGSRDCTIITLRALAKQATNGWACYARTKREHRDIARLHEAIDMLTDKP